MKYAISKISIISEDTVGRLLQAGVDDTDAILDCSETPADRSKFAEEIGITLQDLRLLALTADLLRIKGVGLATAQVIAVTGILNSASDLCHVRPQVLGAAIKRTCKKYPLLKRPPTTYQLREIVDESQELRPRLYIDTPENPNIIEFQKRLLVSTKKKRKRYALLIFGGFVAFSIVVGFITELAVRKITGQGLALGADNTVALAIDQFANGFRLWVYGLLLVAPILALPFWLLIAIVSRIFLLQVAPRIFSSPIHARFFLMMSELVDESVTISRVIKTIPWTFAFFCALLAVSLWFRIDIISTSLVPIAVLVLALIIGYAFWPRIRILWDSSRHIRHVSDAASVQRYLAYTASYMVTLIIILFLATTLLPTSVARVQDAAMGKIFYSPVAITIGEAIAEVEQELTLAKLADNTDLIYRFELQKNLLESYQSDLSKFQISRELANGELQELIREVGIFAISALALVSLFLWIHLILLGGWRKFIWLLLSAIVSFGVEYFLGEYSVDLIRLPRGSLFSVMLIGIGILYMSIILDPAPSSVKSLTSRCRHCRNLNDLSAKYCSSCGGSLI